MKIYEVALKFSLTVFFTFQVTSECINKNFSQLYILIYIYRCIKRQSDISVAAECCLVSFTHTTLYCPKSARDWHLKSNLPSPEYYPLALSQSHATSQAA